MCHIIINHRRVQCISKQKSHVAKREEKQVVVEEEDGRLSLYNDGNVCNHYNTLQSL
jgi:DNA integrity scanning protein DisA with diadenylate cyclase activity